MQCGELERYLEAFLDGRLGRSRSALLRRHLAGCVGCRTRVEKLKQFEREVARHVRAMGCVAPMWSGLDFDLVRSAQTALPEGRPGLRLLPPPQPKQPARTGREVVPPPQLTVTPRKPKRRRRLASGVAGTVLIAAAAGALLEFWTGWLSGTESAASGVRSSYLAYLKGDKAVDFGTADANSLQNWFKTQFGQDFPLPPEPDGFRIVGGRLADLAGERAAVIIYAKSSSSALLYIMPRDDIDQGSTLPVDDLPDIGKITQVSWQGATHDFAVVSTLPPVELAGFAPSVRDKL